MLDLTKLPHGLEPHLGVCLAVIETPKGRQSKFDYDRATRSFRLKTMLPAGMSFPLDFGFIPSTLCDDGDPLDVMVLMDEPASVGVVLDVRLIGVIEAEEQEGGRTERNDRLIAIAAMTRLYGRAQTPDDLPAGFIDNLMSFWTNKGRLEGKNFRTLAVRGPAAAVDLVRVTSKAASTAGSR